MAEVKWIKIVTDIFDDEKIRYIETLPDGDTIALLWFRLMCLAGKSNSGGYLMLADRIPYTEDMLASIFNRDIKIVRLSLQTFEALSMIEIIDNRYYLINWQKHQSAEKLQEIRDKTKLRTQRYRERLTSGNVTTVSQERHNGVTVTQQNKKENIDIDKSIIKDGQTEESAFGVTQEEATRLRDDQEAIYSEAWRCGLPVTQQGMDTAIALYAAHGLDKLLEAIRKTGEQPKEKWRWPYVKGILTAKPKEDDGVW